MQIKQDHWRALGKLNSRASNQRNPDRWVSPSIDAITCVCAFTSATRAGEFSPDSARASAVNALAGAIAVRLGVRLAPCIEWDGPITTAGTVESGAIIIASNAARAVFAVEHMPSAAHVWWYEAYDDDTRAGAAALRYWRSWRISSAISTAEWAVRRGVASVPRIGVSPGVLPPTAKAQYDVLVIAPSGDNTAIEFHDKIRERGATAHLITMPCSTVELLTASVAARCVACPGAAGEWTATALKAGLTGRVPVFGPENDPAYVMDIALRPYARAELVASSHRARALESTIEQVTALLIGQITGEQNGING